MAAALFDTAKLARLWDAALAQAVELDIDVAAVAGIEALVDAGFGYAEVAENGAQTFIEAGILIGLAIARVEAPARTEAS